MCFKSLRKIVVITLMKSKSQVLFKVWPEAKRLDSLVLRQDGHTFSYLRVCRVTPSEQESGACLKAPDAHLVCLKERIASYFISSWLFWKKIVMVFKIRDLNLNLEFAIYRLLYWEKYLSSLSLSSVIWKIEDKTTNFAKFLLGRIRVLIRE